MSRPLAWSPTLLLSAASSIAAGAAFIYWMAGVMTQARIDADLGLAQVQAIQALRDEYRRTNDVPVAISRVVSAYRPRSTNLVVLNRSTGTETNARHFLPADDPALVFLTVPRIDTIVSILSRYHGPVPGRLTAGSRHGPVRVHLREVQLAEHEIVIASTRSLAEVGIVQREIARVLLPWAVLVFLGTVIPTQLALRRAIRRLNVLAQEAEQLARQEGRARLPLDDGPASIERLVVAVNRLLERQDRVQERQRAFLALVSHELRTPVSVLTTETEGALDNDTADQAELRATLRSIRQETGTLRRLVDDLFIIARANAGEDILRRVPLYLDDLVRESLDVARRQAAAHGDTPRFELEVQGEDFATWGDDAMLLRALSNLLSNAVRHSADGAPVRVVLRAIGDTFEVDVINRGEPIPPADQGRLFEMFFRASRTREGTGLGLAVAQVVAAGHGGTAALVSSDAEGTVFRITLPRQNSTGGALPR